MDKQQATKFILTRLQAGYPAEEISVELSRLLKAPADKVRPFVDQVAARQPVPPVASPPSDPDPRPDWMQDIAATTPDHNDPKQIRNLDLPPGLQAILLENGPQAKEIPPRPVAGTSSPVDSDLPRPGEFVPQEERSGAKTSSGFEEQNQDFDALAADVLNQLKKKRRNNDIVEEVCRQTGWHWNKSQRFVARVKTKNFEELQSAQNRTTIIIGVIILLVGLVLTIAGASSLAEYAQIAEFAKTNPDLLLSISPEEAFFTLFQTVTGLGMVAGGIYGISRVVTNH